LKKLGLTAERIHDKDAFFFLQLLLPIGDPSKSGVEDDPRMPFYSKVETWTRLYAAEESIGGSYGHSFKEILIPDLVKYHGAVIRDGVLGASDGAIHRQWGCGIGFVRSTRRHCHVSDKVQTDQEGDQAEHQCYCC